MSQFIALSTHVINADGEWPKGWRGQGGDELYRGVRVTTPLAMFSGIFFILILQKLNIPKKTDLQ